MATRITRQQAKLNTLTQDFSALQLKPRTRKHTKKTAPTPPPTPTAAPASPPADAVPTHPAPAPPTPTPTPSAKPPTALQKKKIKKTLKSRPAFWASTLPTQPCVNPNPNTLLDIQVVQDMRAMDSLDLPTVTKPVVVEEQDLPDPAILPFGEDNLVDEPEFQILETGSQRGKPLLIDDQGFSYVHARIGKKITAWRCSVRSSAKTCPATVSQQGNVFSRGPQLHNHSGNPSAAPKTRLKIKLKEQVKEQVFESAQVMVEAAIMQEKNQFGLRPQFPTTANLIRLTNKARAQCRPQDPKDLQFEYNNDFRPGFCIGDLNVEGKRHLMFANSEQLVLLSMAKRWYLDGTFKVVRDPFYQLWSIHAFAKNGDEMKQVPLVFVVMSSRSL